MHYGVYVGNNEVVHFSADKENRISAKKAFIQKTTLSDFSEKGNLQAEIPADNSMCFPPNEVVKRALSNVGKGKGEYNLVFNNCEHFANWCKYGTKISNQVKNVVKIVATLAVTATVVTSVAKIIKNAIGDDKA